MTTILEALKNNERNISVGNSQECTWMSYDSITGDFVVMGTVGHKATELYRGPDEHAAVAALLGEQNDTIER